MIHFYKQINSVVFTKKKKFKSPDILILTFYKSD